MLCFNRRLGCLQGQSPISMEDLNTIFTSTAEAGKFFKPYKYFRTPFYRRFEKAVLKLHWYDVIKYSYISNRFSFSFYFCICIICIFSITDKEIECAVQRLKSTAEESTENAHASCPNLLLSMMTDGRLTKDRINLLITNLFGGGIDSVSSHILNTYVYSMFTFACIQLHAYTQFHLWIQLLHSIYTCIYTCTINCQHVCYCLHLGIPASECISYWRDNVHL